jgi:hypothetical protein
MDRLDEVLARQSGVVSRRQLVELGCAPPTTYAACCVDVSWSSVRPGCTWTTPANRRGCRALGVGSWRCGRQLCATSRRSRWRASWPGDVARGRFSTSRWIGTDLRAHRPGCACTFSPISTPRCCGTSVLPGCGSRRQPSTSRQRPATTSPPWPCSLTPSSRAGPPHAWNRLWRVEAGSPDGSSWARCWRTSAKAPVPCSSTGTSLASSDPTGCRSPGVRCGSLLGVRCIATSPTAISVGSSSWTGDSSTTAPPIVTEIWSVTSRSPSRVG